MPFFAFLPSLIRRRPDRAELTIPAAARLAYLAVGAAFVFLLYRGFGGAHAVTWLLGGIVALAGLSEDRWIFDLGAREMRRRYGLLLIAKSWAVDLGEISSIELDLDAWETASADPYVQLPGNIRKGYCSLRVMLAGGKALTLCAVPGKRADALRERGKAIAALIDRPFAED